jgi:hypothetical protein
MHITLSKARSILYQHATSTYANPRQTIGWEKLASTATADLEIPKFNNRSLSAHIINGLATHYLLLCGQICDAGYRVLFEEEKANIFEGDVTVHGKVLM